MAADRAAAQRGLEEKTVERRQMRRDLIGANGCHARYIGRFCFHPCVLCIANPTDAEKVTMVAVGGYGRGRLAPHSDIDLLFLLPYKRNATSESFVEYILYMLWDLGLKVGHATRTVNECVTQAQADMTVRTAMLESRCLWGSSPLFESL